MSSQPVLHRNDAAEEAVIGAMLCAPEACEFAIEHLKEKDFYKPEYRTAFRGMKELFNAGKTCDEITVGDACRTGSPSFDPDCLGRAIIRVPNAAGIGGYVDSVRSASLARALSDMSLKIQGELGRGAKSEEILAFISKETDRINSRLAGREQEPESISVLAERAAQDCQQPARRLSGPACGIVEVDLLVDGWESGSYTVVAAPPSLGKTTFAQAVLFGFRQNNPDLGRPLIMTTENQPMARAQSALASALGVDIRDFKRGNISAAAKRKALELVKRGEMDGVDVILCGGWTLAQVRACCIRHKRKHGLPMLIVDMPEHLTPDGGDSREAQIASISSGLFNLTKELGCATIAVAQINREGVRTKQQGDEIRMHNIRNSGQIEGDADRIVILSRDDYLGGVDDRTKVYLAKDRAGGWAGKSCWVRYNKETGRIMDCIPEVKK